MFRRNRPLIARSAARNTRINPSQFPRSSSMGRRLLALSTSAFRPRARSTAPTPCTDPDYSAAYVVLHTDAARARGHGLTFTNGRGTEVVRRRRPRARAARRRPDARGHHRRHAGVLAQPRLRQPAALARPEKGVMHLAHGRGRQCGLGSVGQARGQAALAAAHRPAARGARRCDRLPLHRRTRSRRTRRSTSCAARRRDASSASASSLRAAATPPTRRRPAGSATTTRSRGARARRRRRRVPHVKMKVGRDLEPTSAAPRSSARRSAPTAC